MPTNRTRTRARVAALATALAVPLAVAACGTDSTAGAPAASPSAMATSASPTMAPSSPAMSPSGAMTGEPFGAACGQVPSSGKGSFDGMSSDPVATAASNNPLLSTLVSAVGEAGLADTLNTTDDITVFAPTNDAFKAMDQATLKKAMADQKLLRQVLTLHVVPGRLGPDELAGSHKTLNGQSITVEGSGEEFAVGDAKVVCGNVQTANASVYIIDAVLLPTA